MKTGPSWIEDFSGGCVQHLPPTRLPANVSPRSWNTALRPVSGGSLLVTKRPGYRLVAHTGGATGSTLVATGFYNYEEAGTITTHHVGVDTDGKVFELLYPTCTLLTIPTGTFGFPASTLAGVSNGVQFVQANNQLIGWVRGAKPFKVYRKPSDSTLYVGAVGIPAPTAPTLNTTSTGNLSGTVDFHLTYYNSTSGVESSAGSDLTIDITGTYGTTKTIKLNLPTTGPGEVTHVRVYLRKQQLQTDFYRNDTMQVTLGTATIDLSFTDPQLNAQILLSPDTLENAPPPSTAICAWWHLARMFISDGKFLYYSKIGNSDQFDPASVENPGRGDGQRLTALRSLNDQVLGLFKERSIWGLIGSGVQTWSMQQLSGTFGTNSTLSLCEGDGLIGFWSENGPVIWDKSGEPQLLVNETLLPLVQNGTILLNRRDKILGAFDPVGHRFLWKLDTSSPWSIAPWSTRYRVWEAIGWDLGTVTSMTLGPSSSAELRVFFGGPEHVLYELANTLRTDAASSESGTLWTTVVSGTTAGLVLAYGGAFAVNPYLSVARLISLSTLSVHRSTYTLNGSALTWDTASSFTPAVGDIVVFDCPAAEYATPAIQEGMPSQRHRILQTYMEAWSNADVPIVLGLFVDNVQTPRNKWLTTIARTNFITTGPGPSLTELVPRHKRWAGCQALWHQFRAILWYPLAEHGVTRFGWTSDIQGDED